MALGFNSLYYVVGTSAHLLNRSFLKFQLSLLCYSIGVVPYGTSSFTISFTSLYYVMNLKQTAITSEVIDEEEINSITELPMRSILEVKRSELPEEKKAELVLEASRLIFSFARR